MKAVLRGFLVFFILSIATVAAVYPQTPFSRGEELFMQDKPQEALEFLEKTIASDSAHVKAFLYLGIVYQQLDRLDDAIAVYERILPRAGAETARIAYNLGNAYFANGDFDQARKQYTLAIKADQAFSSAYLNRANTLVRSGELEEALYDYETYLSLEPESPKREEAEALMAFILEEFARELEHKLEQKLTQNTAAKPEMDSRTRLILEVTESLRTLAEESRGFSTSFEDSE